MKICFRIAYVLITILLLFGCKESQAQDMTKYLALGDSYTIGESVKASERYPNQLVLRLKEQGFNFSKAKIIAKTGWRTDDLISAIETEQIKDTFQLVSLLIGVNNQYQGKPIKQFEKELRQLIDLAIGFAGNDTTRVFLVSIPDYGYTPFGKKNQQQISKEISIYNGLTKQIALEYSIAWYNITPISQLGIENPQLIAEDGLHPSGKMYAQWVDYLFEDIIKNHLKH